MNWEIAFYYTGYALALVLYRGLGKIFFVPMVINVLFNIALELRLFAGWDVRWIIVGYGFLFFVWICAMAGTFDKITVVALLGLELVTVYREILPTLAMSGTGADFWNQTSTSIFNVWMVLICGVSTSVVFRSSVVSKVVNGYSQLLAIPRKRFLIPVALWSGIIIVPTYFGNLVPDIIRENRFDIAACVLVWGWVAFEAPFYIMYRRMREHYSKP